MNRREAIKTTVLGGAVIMLGQSALLAKVHYPKQVDEQLFQGINRVKKSGEEKGLELLHSPVIKAPDVIKSGQVFQVDEGW
jgi:hypothetical protein